MNTYRPVCEDKGGFLNQKKHMTDKDKKLIEKALQYGFTGWGEVLDLAEQADTDEARNELHSIAMSLYHREEAAAGCL